MIDQKTKDFLSRVVVYMADGMEMEPAMRRVLADDERLYSALMDRTRYEYDGYNTSHRTREGKGDVIRREMAKLIYQRIRGAAA